MRNIRVPGIIVTIALAAAVSGSAQSVPSGGQQGVASVTDHNGDGHINVLDIWREKRLRLPGREQLPPMSAATGSTEQIEVAEPIIELPHCGSGSILFHLRNSTTPLFGYSLAIELQPQAGSSGAVVIDAGATNFYAPQNLITAAGAPMDPLFTIIAGQDEGVFVSTNTADGSTVLAADGVNDVLVEVHFIAEPNAVGDFTFVLGPATALSDGAGFPVPFNFTTGTIIVADGALTDINDDGTVNVDDLVAVILSWGPCPTPPATCAADTNGDGSVDVDDLVAIILSWNCGL